MKHTLSDSDFTILEHILYVAEKPAKVVHFCFKKGTEQAYITPRKDILVTFNLSTPIKFDYPIANLRTFLAEAVKWSNDEQRFLRDGIVDSDTNSCDITELVLPSSELVKSFQTKIVDEIPFSYDDYKRNLQLKVKYKFLNIMGIDKKLIFRYQDHYRNWWYDDNNNLDVPKGKSRRKYRYVIGRHKLRLLPNHYNLIIRERTKSHAYGVLQFQHKHLNYYFKPEVSWTKQSIKDWTNADDLIYDEHLIKQYVKKGHMIDRYSFGENHIEFGVENSKTGYSGERYT